MDYKKNYKYFYANWVIVIIGCCIAGFGLILITIFRFTSYFMGMVIIGAGIAVFSFTGKLKDADIDEMTGESRKTINDKALKEFAFTDRQLRDITSHDFGEYEFPESGTLHVRHGGDGKYRSSRYCVWSISIGRDELYFYAQRYSLTEEDESHTRQTLKLDDYAGAEITEHTFINKYGKDNSKTREIKFYTFDFHKTGGETISLPVHPDINADELIKKLDHLVNIRRKQSAENN